MTTKLYVDPSAINWLLNDDDEVTACLEMGPYRVYPSVLQLRELLATSDSAKRVRLAHLLRRVLIDDVIPLAEQRDLLSGSIAAVLARAPDMEWSAPGEEGQLWRYYEALRLLAIHLAALRFFRLAIPSCSNSFAPIPG